jgi:hypothetical protein
VDLFMPKLGKLKIAEKTRAYSMLGGVHTLDGEYMFLVKY